MSGAPAERHVTGPHEDASAPARPSTAIEVVGVVTVSIALTAWWLWPLPTVLATHAGIAAFPDYVADYHLIAWGLAWGAHALVHQPLALFDANTFHPATYSLAFSEHFLGHQPVFAPIYWMTGNPILGANVILFVSYPLSVAAMYLLARRWMDGPAAALAALLYAFTPLRYISGLWVHLAATWYFPIVFLCSERWLERARTADAVALGVATALQMLTSIYLAYGLVVVYAAYLPLALWRWRDRLDRRRAAGLVIAIGAATIVMGAASAPYLILQHMGVIPSYADGLEPLPVPIAMAPRMVARQLRESLMGPIGYALAVVALVPPWRGRRWPLVVGVVVAAVGVGAACGPTIVVGSHAIASPYRLLARWVPGLSSIRSVVRFLLPAQVGMTLLAGLGVGRVSRRLSPATGWLVAVVLAAAVLRSYAPLPAMAVQRQPIGDAVPPEYRWLAEHGDGLPLVEIGRRTMAAEARRMLLSTVHWLPIVGGYSAYTSTSATFLYGIADRLPNEGALQDLVDWVDVGWVLVHRDELAPAVATRWSTPLPSGLERAGEWGPALLLRVTRPVVDDRRARLRLDTTVSIGGAPLASLAPSCSGRLRLTTFLPSPWPPLEERELGLSLANDGDRTWPGRAVVARHLLRLRACLAEPGASDCVTTSLPLSDDVAPGRMQAERVRVRAPMNSGPYELLVRLVQVGDGPLDRCGVEPLRIAVQVGGRASAP